MFTTCFAVSLLALAGDRAAPKKSLVARDRVLLNLAGAETVLQAAKQKAAAMGLKVNIAVVDDGWHRPPKGRRRTGPPSFVHRFPEKPWWRTACRSRPARWRLRETTASSSSTTLSRRW